MNDRIEVSIGISGIKVHEFTDVEVNQPHPNIYFEKLSQQLIKEADIMLYSVKKDKKIFVNYSSPMPRPPIEQFHL